jgi:hypothetical protein
VKPVKHGKSFPDHEPIIIIIIIGKFLQPRFYQIVYWSVATFTAAAVAIGARHTEPNKIASSQ